MGKEYDSLHSYIKHSLINMNEYEKLIRPSFSVHSSHSIHIFHHFLLDIMNQEKIEVISGDGKAKGEVWNLVDTS